MFVLEMVVQRLATRRNGSDGQVSPTESTEPPRIEPPAIDNNNMQERSNQTVTAEAVSRVATLDAPNLCERD